MPITQPVFQEPSVQLEIGAASDVGQLRSLNEDSYFTGAQIAVVADGMGGHACGDVASDLTVREFQALQSRASLTVEDVQSAIRSANESILAGVLADPSKKGMGTTVAGIALVDYLGESHWLVFNVGDSRVYRLDRGQPVQLTVDHSEVAELVAAGRITAEEALVHPLRNVITRSLGTDPVPQVDVWIFPPHEGDSFLVCSDGLTNELDDDAIAGTVAGATSPNAAAAALIDAANQAGGQDNITAIVLRTAPDGVEEAAPVRTAPRKTEWER